MVDFPPLSPDQRDSLLQLGRNKDQTRAIDRQTQTGRRVGQSSDDYLDFVRIRSWEQNLNQIKGLSGHLDQGISALQSHVLGLESVVENLEILAGLIIRARNNLADTEALRTLDDEFIRTAEQIPHFIADTEYEGLRLLDRGKAQLRLRLYNKPDESELVVNSVFLLSELRDEGGIFDEGRNWFDDQQQFELERVIFDDPDGDPYMFTGFTAIADSEVSSRLLDGLDGLVETLQKRVTVVAARYENHIHVFQIARDGLARSEDSLIPRAIADTDNHSDQERIAEQTALTTRRRLAIEGLNLSLDLRRSLLSLAF